MDRKEGGALANLSKKARKDLEEFISSHDDRLPRHPITGEMPSYKEKGIVKPFSVKVFTLKNIE